MAEGQKNPLKINIIVKTPKEKVDIQIEEDASIKDVSPFYPVLYFSVKSFIVGWYVMVPLLFVHPIASFPKSCMQF